MYLKISMLALFIDLNLRDMIK